MTITSAAGVTFLETSPFKSQGYFTPWKHPDERFRDQITGFYKNYQQHSSVNEAMMVMKDSYSSLTQFPNTLRPPVAKTPRFLNQHGMMEYMGMGNSLDMNGMGLHVHSPPPITLITPLIQI